MTHLTPDDLVRYLYNETSTNKSEILEEALNSDMSLRETFESLIASKKNLEETNLSPRPEAVDKILKYAGKQQKELHSQ